MTLRSKLVLQMIVPLMLLGLALFVPAGTLRFWQAWAFLGVWFIPGIFFSIYFYKHDKALVQRRLEGKEKLPGQNWLIRAMFVMLLVAFVIPGLDYRFGWSKQWFGGPPVWLEIASLLVVLAAYLLAIRVMAVNRYAARTIRVEAEQTVVSTGPYKWVRHPMYSAAVVMFLLVALALGSYVALPVFLLVIPFFVVRLLSEEQVLRGELPGYAEYCQGTRYRLVPYLW